MVNSTMRRGKMNREERAKQFMPFSALKGHAEALRKKEKIIVPKIEVSEEYAQELDRKLRQVKKNDIVTIVYFRKGEYLKQTGMVARIDETARILQVVNTKIYFDDIYDVNGECIES
ncbi:MAG: YolD-like family protein [Dorea sp.]